jgi:hypothetical protein
MRGDDEDEDEKTEARSTVGQLSNATSAIGIRCFVCLSALIGPVDVSLPLPLGARHQQQDLNSSLSPFSPPPHAHTRCSRAVRRPLRKRRK